MWPWISATNGTEVDTAQGGDWRRGAIGVPGGCILSNTIDRASSCVLPLFDEGRHAVEQDRHHSLVKVGADGQRLQSHLRLCVNVVRLLNGLGGLSGAGSHLQRVEGSKGGDKVKGSNEAAPIELVFHTHRAATAYILHRCVSHDASSGSWVLSLL